MTRFITCFVFLCGVLPCADKSPAADGDASTPIPACPAASRFADAWIKVAERSCLKCDHEGGDASDSAFVLKDTIPLPTSQRAAAWSENCVAFTEMAMKVEADGRSRLLAKATGALDHGGGEVLKPDSTEFRILEALIDGMNQPAESSPATYPDVRADSFFDGVEMISEQRRTTAARLPHRERAENMLYAAQWNSHALSQVTPHIPKEIPKDPLSQQAEIALASFKAGVCVSANLTIGQFDSHQKNDEDQMKLLPRFLASIDYLLRRAEYLQIRDKLVLVIQSEMGRTPSYNQGDGKDHWSIGSIMFLGPNIQGNRVIGATDEKQFAIPLDPKSLAFDPDHGIRVRPEHMHIAMRQLAWISDHPLSEPFPFKVDDAERLFGLWG